MKTELKLMAASLLVLSMAACSPSNPSAGSSAAASEAVSTAQSAADNVNPDNAPVPEPEAPVSDTVESSAVASSVAIVIAQSTGAYDPAVITEMGRKPGYWEVRHTDPSTHKEVIDKVCIDKATGDRLVHDGGHVSAPASQRGVKSAANWLGNCPADTRAGDVVRHDGSKVNAWQDNRPENHAAPTPPAAAHDQKNNKDHSQDGHDQNTGHGSSSASDHGHDQAPAPAPAPAPAQSHNPHTTPAQAHDGHSSSQASSSSHDRNDRGHQG